MNPTVAILAVLAGILLVIALIRKPESVPLAFKEMSSQLLMFGLRLPLALLSAAFFSMLIPPDAVAPYIGPESGVPGMFIAMLFGAVIPGGPILTFPLALVVWRTGAGQAQMIALLASWSIFAMHRIITYELPLLGPRFVALRLASSGLLPILAGVMAMIFLYFWSS